MTGILYCITNQVNGKQYIGQTTQKLKRRYSKHITDAARGKFVNQPILHAISKYGSEKFSVAVLETHSHENKTSLYEILDAREKTIIQEFNTFVPAGYNATTGGRKCKQAAVNVKQRRVPKGSQHPNWGKHHSATAIERNRQSNIEFWSTHPSPSLGLKQTEEQKQKNRIAHLGRHHTIISKEKMSATRRHTIYLISPTGQILNIRGKTINEQGVGRKAIYNSLKKHRPILSGPYTGWTCQKILASTEGT